MKWLSHGPLLSLCTLIYCINTHKDKALSLNQGLINYFFLDSFSISFLIHSSLMLSNIEIANNSYSSGTILCISKNALISAQLSGFTPYPFELRWRSSRRKKFQTWVILSDKVTSSSNSFGRTPVCLSTDNNWSLRLPPCSNSCFANASNSVRLSVENLLHQQPLP